MDIEQARELVSSPVLWPRVRDFLWDFAPQVHSSWLNGLPGHEMFVTEDDSSQVSCIMSNPKTKAFVLSSLGVEPCFHAFPKDDGSRLLLLDGATLVSVAKWLGALSCADALRKVMDGATVRALKAELPGVYPEVFGYTEYFRKLKVEKLKVEKLTPQFIVETGVVRLFSFVSRLPQPLLKRLALKLPRGLQPSDSSTFNPSTLQPFNLQLLLKLRFPEAYSLCCS